MQRPASREESRCLFNAGPKLAPFRRLRRSPRFIQVAQEYLEALHREVTYSEIPPRGLGTGAEKGAVARALDWHLVTMAELNRAGRYDRMSDGVERVTGRPAMRHPGMSLHADEFGGRRS